MQEVNDLSKRVIGCAIEVHKVLGPGLLENAYEECLFYKIRKEGMWVERQKSLPLYFEEVKMDVGYRVDFLIEEKFVLEIKKWKQNLLILKV